MLVRDVRGHWYDLPDEVLEGKKLEKEKVLELLASERAQRRKKIELMIGELDALGFSVLRQVLLQKGHLKSHFTEKHIGKSSVPPLEGDCPPCLEGDCPPCLEGDCPPCLEGDCTPDRS